jgi:putative nucleotidyltransferase with HDIG domain
MRHLQEKIEAFKHHVREVSANPEFLHHQWFAKWHLEVVEKIALELADKYPEADRDLVEVMAWLHDYGKIFDHDNQYEKTLTAGREKLTELGFPIEFVDKAISGIETLDKKMEIDLHQAPIEVQIVSSADGCAHMVGPFMFVFWNYETDQTFVGKSYEELMQLNLVKANKDWSRKIVLPEARAAFEHRYQHIIETSGQLPDRFLP